MKIKKTLMQAYCNEKREKQSKIFDFILLFVFFIKENPFRHFLFILAGVMRITAGFD
jgi:hypothetical protein